MNHPAFAYNNNNNNNSNNNSNNHGESNNSTDPENMTPFTLDLNPIRTATATPGYLAYRVHNFSPAWFSMTMGVGIAGNIIYAFPFPLSTTSSRSGLHNVGLGIIIADMVIFALFLALLTARYCVHGARREWNEGQGMFFGCIPMGFCTIVNVVSNRWSSIAGYAMWWVAVAAAIGVTAAVGTHGVSSGRKQGMTEVTANMILPIVSLVVAASTGGVVATNPDFPQGLKASTLVVSLLMWGCGNGLALLLMAVYLCRLVISGLPGKGIIISNLLFVGPMGQGAYGIFNLADVFVSVFERPIQEDPASISELSLIRQFAGSAPILASFVAITFVAVGLFWITLTALAILFRTGPPHEFNQSFWSLTFPIGTMTMAWFQMGVVFESTTFKVIGSVFGAFVFGSVLGCTIASIKYGLLGDDLFKQAEEQMSRA
ncbi:similar to Saccharomyces cerevisiae YPL092W SSU1 Plasma membrane sulfite pump involved in sulfite metabolism and required for efficient sulfite efflux [Geotrichum candidum]|uniref:Similar to Saccharomyces cerevisiae YPL092W SSU1 Plasma membrane sulfite pump involved in sulfite metabolism and required for efficient sulfite efflux n=1 Tax=Geotrichum candidum TaxID=1173061 RepID=A0A0J9XDY4_GEOCN|nr:similar to Saccharomyces cerevisiae YPL092W SSU1 Plasma membrane sulfite pump involved in sulfite metabolism and required for efficient sulfite efflux [Geotrichum candidum]